MKIIKFLLATMGACNKVMSMFIPIAVALSLLVTMDMSNNNAIILLLIATMSSLFRAISIWID